MWLLGVVLMVLPIGHAVAGTVTTQASYRLQDAASGAALLKAEGRTSQAGADMLLETRFLQLPAEGGALAGVETLRFRPDSLLAVSYHFEDLVAGELADVRIKDGVASASYRASADGEVKSGELAWDEHTFAGSALPMLISKHWRQLQGGASVDFELYVPFRLETIGFRLSRASPSDGGDVTIVAAARNWLIRQFAPSISFTFTDAAVPQLARYRGPAPVAVSGEKHKTVIIDFTKDTVLGQNL